MFLTGQNGFLPIYFGSHYSYLALRNVSFWSLAGTMVFDVTNRPSATSHSRGTKPPCWREKVALGEGKQRKLPFQIMYVFCLSCPCATFALQRGGFVPGEWLQRAYCSEHTDVVTDKRLMVSSLRDKFVPHSRALF